MGSAASTPVTTDVYLTPTDLFEYVAYKILGVIAPKKEIATTIEEEEGAYFSTWGGGAESGLRKNLSSKEKELFIEAVAFVINHMSSYSSIPAIKRYLTSYNSHPASDKVQIPTRFITQHFSEMRDRDRRMRLEEVLQQFKEIQNLYFYESSLEYRFVVRNSNEEVSVAKAEIEAGVKSYHDNKALEDLKIDIGRGNPRNVDDSLAWLEKRGFNLQAVEEKFELLPHAIENRARTEVVKHLVENLGCNIAARSDLFCSAVANSTLETIEYLLRKYPPENHEFGVILRIAAGSFLEFDGEEAAEKDKIAAFLLSKRRLLKNHLQITNEEAADLLLLADYGMIEATQEIIKNTQLSDLLDILASTKSPKLRQAILSSLDKTKESEEKIISQRGIDLHEPELGSDILCPISHEIMKHPVQICDANGTPLFGDTFDREFIETHLRLNPINPMSREQVPSGYTLVTNSQIVEKIADHFLSEYQPAIEELIAANCPLKAHELLNSIGEETIQNFSEEQKKWRAEKTREIAKMTQNKLVVTSVESLAKEGQDRSCNI